MTWDKLGQFKLGPQNIRELHVGNVYEDNEFINEVARLFPERRELLLHRKGTRPEDTNKLNIILKKIGSLNETRCSEIANKFSISLGDLKWYLTGDNLREGEFYRKSRKPFRAVDLNEETIVLEFNRNITKEDYDEAWRQWLAPSKNETKQPKLPVHDKLLYAIYKAREHRGETFKQIFRQYEEGTLPGYTGSNSMFSSSQKKFEEYYRKYRFK